MTEPVFTAKVCADNSEQFPGIMDLYVLPGARVLDLTFGRGVFWKEIPARVYKVTRNDLDPERGDISHDFGALPRRWSSRFDAVVFDPPYKSCGNLQTPDRYGNKAGGYKGIMDRYQRGISEAARVLKPGGKLIVKCQDQVHSGKRHFYRQRIVRMFPDLGFRLVDEFVYVQKNTRPQPNGRSQVHALSNHSYFLVASRRR